MRKHLYRGIIRLLNSRRVGKLIEGASRASVTRWFVPLYVKVFGIKTDELEKQLREYNSLQEFFVRRLRAEARPVLGDEDEIISPVDAKVEQFGGVKDTLIEVKGITYSIDDLLRDQEMIMRYQKGSFLVLYLSPKDYHRIHSPAHAVVEKQFELGGTSTPVNKWGLTLGKSPLTTNYRMVTELKQEDGTFLALVKVGAMWINTIELTHPRSRLSKGEEVGFFSFGSTVVLLFENGKVNLHPDLKRQGFVKVGEPVARKT
ncbi:archaetidylserine decarboxylase [Halobacillus faecis]|uniref:phosphatidylserine decarboxylase n=1 Tax=Halobacillus faecis TaxID=360184 RepID=A0A511WME4_9BACI|nr:archaetidylserine decarboxylase [Halobacillus faecis]GEN52225.1 phosphatidylserine decarboxylase proenzyme [Halobacillus faecis]